MAERFEDLYRSLFLIRRVEEEVARLYPTDRIKSPVHLSIGQEAVSVGVCAALAPQDVVFGTYRGHALYLAKGGDLPAMIAELYGKADGCARGKGGSMHLVDVAAGMMGTSAVVATGIPQAVGYALALRAKGSDAVVVCFMGDGAVEEGVFHESLNFAALRRLPILFVCENNGYAIHTRLAQRQATGDICGLVRAHGLSAARIEGGDTLEIRDRAAAAVALMRRGEAGPQFLECLTYRWMAHVGPERDLDEGHRPPHEAAPWVANDEVARMGARLTPEARARVEAAVADEIAAAFAFAEASPFPAPEALWADVFLEA